jgi:hypothetical protein
LERLAKLRVERLLLEGQYVSREEITRRDVAKVAAVKSGLMQLQRRIAPHLTPAALALVEESVRALCNAFAGEDAPRSHGDTEGKK